MSSGFLLGKIVRSISLLNIVTYTLATEIGGMKPIGVEVAGVAITSTPRGLHQSVRKLAGLPQKMLSLSSRPLQIFNQDHVALMLLAIEACWGREGESNKTYSRNVNSTSSMTSPVLEH